MIQTINNVNITGKLVKMGLEKKTDSKGNEVIGGSLILRTSDGSEHEVNYYANRYKKDANGNFTSDESGLYKGYETIINEFKSLETNPDDADVVSIGCGSFGTQDYINKQDNSTLMHYNNLNGKFANRLTAQEIEVTPQVATFEVQGVITKVIPETRKDETTGNYEIHLDIIGYNGTIVPIKLIVDKDKAEAFTQAGFYESGAGKFSGSIINNKQIETIVEKQAFGEDITKTITTTVRKYDISGGTPQGSIYDIKLTDEEYELCKSKRRVKLEEIKNKETNRTASGFTPANNTPNTPPPTTGANPFANPFAKK